MKWYHMTGQLLWDVVGCEAVVGDWKEFTWQEQRLILYASFYGMEAPKRVPFQKRSSLGLPETDIKYEYHNGHLLANSCNASGEDLQMEQVVVPPNLNWMILSSLILRFGAFGITCLHKWPMGTKPRSWKKLPRREYLLAIGHPKAIFNTKTERESRGPSRSHPLQLGMVIVAALRGKYFPNFDKVMSCILPCEVEEAVAFFALSQWVTRLTSCETHEEVQLRSTWQDRHRAERIQKRIHAAVRHCAKYGGAVSHDYGEDNSAKDEQPVEAPPKRQ